MPTARTRGSANRSSIMGWAALVALALPTATNVAVAPTLVAKSQLSSCVRTTAAPFSDAPTALTQLTESVAALPTTNPAAARS